MNNMLEEVKMLLNLTDDSKDNLINYYLNKVDIMVRDYCNIPTDEELNTPLQDFIIFKVAAIVGSGMNFGTGSASASGVDSSAKVKSISRGDTTITFGDRGVGVTENGYSTTLYFNKDEKSTLNRQRRFKFCSNKTF